MSVVLLSVEEDQRFETRGSRWFGIRGDDNYYIQADRFKYVMFSGSYMPPVIYIPFVSIVGEQVKRNLWI